MSSILSPETPTYSNDTRTISPGEIYVAIRGETYDGHAFVDEAVDRGAAGLIVAGDRDVPEYSGVDVIRVDDPEKHVAETARKKLGGIRKLIAITGSVGKTSTKNAIVSVVRQSHHVVASEGNLNTILGLALTLLNARITSDTVCVLEMGATHAGDIRKKCEYFPPNVSVVTNVQPVHLSSFGTMETIAKTKGELVDALDEDGVACLNYDDPLVRSMSTRNKGRTIYYGMDEDADVRPEVIKGTLPMLGEHAVYNAMAAVCVGRALGIAAEEIERGLAVVEAEKGRLRALDGRHGSLLIDDSYNSSPAAAHSALRVLEQQASLQPSSRKIAFLGDMLELGDREREEHETLIRAAVDAADVVVLVGDVMSMVVSSLPDVVRDRVHLFDTSAQVVDALSDARLYDPREGDVILVKGSQGVRMEHISRQLLHPDIVPKDVLPRQSESWLKKSINE